MIVDEGDHGLDLGREVPSIHLMIKPVTSIDLAEQIDLGRIDVAIGVFSAPPSRFHTALLFEYDDVLIVGRKRKLAGWTRPSLHGGL
jgi:hypothetical protein